MAMKTVLITGCSSGFGKLAAKHFQEKGWQVAATMRSPDKEEELGESDNLAVMALDVTDDASVQAAMTHTKERFGSIDAVVNNAGVGGHGPLQNLDDAYIESIYNTNVFGLMRVCRAAIPYMRSQGSGRIVNVTSMAGYVGLPFETTYCSAKFAAEGFSEALHWELAPFNIKVHTVAPGAFMATSFSQNANDDPMSQGDEELQSVVKTFREHFMGSVTANGGEVADPMIVVNKIYQCATEDMPISNPAGNDAEFLVSMAGPPRSEFLEKFKPLMIPEAYR